MTINKKVIIDTSVLICFTEIRNEVDVFVCLRSIFSQVLIPTEVKAEYERGIEKEPHRNWLLEKLRPNFGFYTLCTQYDTIVLAMIRDTKGIDSGEAEAVAQYNKSGAYYILTDDAKFTNSINSIYPEIRVISSLHIIAIIDFLKLLPDCQVLKRKIHKKLNYKSKQLRAAYELIAKDLGVSLLGRDISKKTSLKNILKD